MRKISIIPQREKIKESIRLSERYQANFEYNDFVLPSVLDDEKKQREIIEFYKRIDRDRSQDTMHGAFFDITLHSMDDRIRKVSEERVRQSMDIAKELGIRGVVFHTNMIANFKEPGYMKNWVDTNAAFYRKMGEEYPGIHIFVENIFDFEPDMICQLAKQMEGEPYFGICLDYAHATISRVGAPEWFEKLKPYIKHMHINDNDLKNDLHQALGTGKIEYGIFNKLLKDSGIEPTVLIEVNGLEQQEASLVYMEKNKIYPF